MRAGSGGAGDRELEGVLRGLDRNADPSQRDVRAPLAKGRDPRDRPNGCSCGDDDP